MLNKYLRAFVTKVFTPVARLFLKLGISPDIVTMVGTLGVCVGALAFYPQREFFWGTIVITAFVFSDTIDGVMARMSGRSGNWGAYLDSTLDRFGDAAIFGGLVLWYAGGGDNPFMAGLALACLILGSVVSYAKARAEGLGMTANVGIAERADRLVAVLAATGLVGLGLPEVLLTVVLALLALASLVTVVQRMLTVRRQALGRHVSGVGDLLAVGGYRLGWATVRRLPERTAYTVFEQIADLAVVRGGKGVDRLRSNYARVRPELSETALDELVRDGMRSYMRYYCEAFRLPDRTPEDLRASVRAVGDQAVRDELAAGRPVLCFLGHLGNWDLAGAWGARELGRVVTVVERLKPEQVYAEFLAFRESLGMTILPLTGGGDVFGELRGHLASPVIMPLLADRDLTARGIEVDLLGHRSKMAAGPAALALASGAALHPVSIHYEPVDGSSWRQRIVITFHDRVTVPESGTTRRKAEAMTQQCATVLGEAIRTHTADWHMLQRVFI